MSDGPDEFLELEDIAKLLKVNARTVKTWIIKGKMPKPAFRVGYSRRWTRKQINAWLENLAQSGQK